MISRNVVFIVTLVVASSSLSVAHDRFWGQCPYLKPMEDFDWKRVTADDVIGSY